MSTLVESVVPLVHLHGIREDNVKDVEIKDFRKSLMAMSITGIARRIRQRQFSSYDVVKAYTMRGRQMMMNNNAFAKVYYNRLLEEATKVDEYLEKLDKDSEEYKNLKEMKPLLGVPVFVEVSLKVKARRNMATEDVVEVLDEVWNSDNVILNRIRYAGGIPMIERYDVWDNVYSSVSYEAEANRISSSERYIIKADRTAIDETTEPMMELRLMDGRVVQALYRDDYVKNMNRTSEDIRVLVRHAEDVVMLYMVLSSTTAPRNYINLKPSKVLVAKNDWVVQTRDNVKEEDRDMMVRLLSKRYNISVEDFELPELHQIIKWYINETSVSLKDMNENQKMNSKMILERLRSLANILPESEKTLRVLDDEHDVVQYQRVHCELVEYRRRLSVILKDNVIAFPILAKVFDNIFEARICFYSIMYNLFKLNVISIPKIKDDQDSRDRVFLATAEDNQYLLIRTQEVLQDEMGGLRNAKHYH